MQIDEIRPRSDGTIDIDAYLEEPHALRAQAYAQFFKHIGRTLAECFRGVIAAFVKHRHNERSISPRFSGQRWCDSTERELSDDLMGQHGWLNSKSF